MSVYTYTLAIKNMLFVGYLSQFVFIFYKIIRVKIEITIIVVGKLEKATEFSVVNDVKG